MAPVKRLLVSFGSALLESRAQRPLQFLRGAVKLQARCASGGAAGRRQTVESRAVEALSKANLAITLPSDDARPSRRVAALAASIAALSDVELVALEAACRDRLVARSQGAPATQPPPPPVSGRRPFPHPGTWFLGLGSNAVPPMLPLQWRAPPLAMALAQLVALASSRNAETTKEPGEPASANSPPN
eukprot:GHVT01087089.1.p1 GENE.GHVT01087089.1~~GHVT01087089.1.p1  ORF type:complete len:188 (-),score=44.70 GHVT01087089.1:426-989(-)